MNTARRTILLERRRRERERQSVKFSSVKKDPSPSEESASKNEKKFDFGCLKGEERLVSPKAIHRVFEDNLMRNISHEKIALIYEDEGVKERVTKYGELNSTANQIANLFLDTISLLPFKPNQDGDFIIGVVSKESDTLISVLLGILKTGAAYMPIDPRYPKKRIENILNDSQPILVVHEDDFKDTSVFSSFKTLKFGDIMRECCFMGSSNISEQKMFDTKENENQKALICFTSGSERQKGVRLSHSTLYNRINWQLMTYPFAKDEHNCVFKTSVSFVDHVPELWCPLISSKTIYVVPRAVVINPDRFIALLDEMEVQRLLIIPSLLRNILMTLNQNAKSGKSKQLSKLRLWMSSGEVLSKNIAHEFFDYFKTAGENILVNLYGATETLDCSVYEIESEKQLEKLDKVPLGLPVHNTLIYIVDRYSNELVEDNEIGEICVSGLTLADGYLSTDSARDEAFVANKFHSHGVFTRLYHTGDFGYIRNGSLFFEGRQDSQVKVNGMRVDLQEINSAVEKLAYIQDTATLVFHPNLPDQTIVSFIVLKDKRNPDEIIEDLRSALIDNMLPQIFLVEKIPRIYTGKIDSTDLLRQYENSLPRESFKINFEYDLKKGLTKDKRKVARKVFETVGVALGNNARMSLDANSNFFRIGGSSINSVTTVNQLRLQGYAVDINLFLKAQNLGEIIDHVSKNKTDASKLKPDIKFLFETFNILDNTKCIEMLVEGYFQKSTLNKYIPGIKKEQYEEMLKEHWDLFERQGLSFMVKNIDDVVIGVTLVGDVLQKLDKFPNSPLKTVFGFIDSIEKPIISNMITTSCVVVFMMGTSPSLDTHTTIALLRFMETKVIEVATKNGYKGILTTNTDPLTIEIGKDFGYETMTTYQINRYVDKDGKIPFINAPDNHQVEVMYKNLSNA